MAIANDVNLMVKRAKLNQVVVKPLQQNGQTKQQNLLDQRQKLPIYAARHEILVQIRKNNCTIIIGETGSGKTTQIPQFLLEEKVNKSGQLYVTQPRRIAAISLSMRVAEEIGCELGTTVGYSVRFDTMISEETQIQYMTDGMLLREAMRDPLLRRASIIVLDEVHERTLHTDVTMGIVKRAQIIRHQKCVEPLKIVVMSATMNVDHFSLYFHNSPVVYVEGRQYPVQLMYASQSVTDYLHSILVAIFQLHKQEPAEHDFLVFLTGQDEIELAVKKIRLLAKELPVDQAKINILPLYAALTPQVQIRAFTPSRKGVRKIILATNIAETSITIPGVRVVIDSGKVKARQFEPSKCIDILKVTNISQSQANQRAGRAGREAPGFCYRLYKESEYDLFKASITPEISRCNLSTVILELLSMKINEISKFDFMDKPPQASIDNAIRQLKFLNAVEEVDSKLQLTLIGRKMAYFPLDPKLSRILLAAEKLSCLEEALTVVSIMSCDSIIITNRSKSHCGRIASSVRNYVLHLCKNLGYAYHVYVLGNFTHKKEESDSVHRKFFAAEGDLLFYLNIFKAYRHSKGARAKEWCIENFVHQRNIETVDKVRTQLKDICLQQGMQISSSPISNESLREIFTDEKHAINVDVFFSQVVGLSATVNLRNQSSRIKALCHGLFLQCAEFTPPKEYKTIDGNLKASIHPSSCLFQHKPSFVLYSELVFTNQLYIRDITLVDANWLIEAAPDYFKLKVLHA